MSTIFITGVSRGIGKALAQEFLERGHNVIGTSRKGVVNFAHPNLTTLPLELTDEKSRKACVQKLIETSTKIDILVNNAAIFDLGDLQPTINVDVLRNTLDANLVGPVDFTERVLPLINEGGHILNISSRRGSLSYVTKALDTCYSISKAALNMFTRHLAFRLKDHITVSAVHPGFVKTDMNDGMGDISPTISAKGICNLALSKHETGQFWWHHGEQFSW